MDDREMIYMTGNGKIAGVYRNGDIESIFGPPYSSPSVLESLIVTAEGAERTKPFHISGAGIWKSALERNGKRLAEITDFALSDEACLVRHIETSEEITIKTAAWNGRKELFEYLIRADESRPEEGFLLKTKNGNHVYNDYPLPFPQFYRIAVKGEAEVTEASDYAFSVRIYGKAELLVIGGPSYPECEADAARIMPMTYERMLADTEAFWAEEFMCIEAEKKVPENVPERQKILKAIEDTVINLVVQQSEEGGVLAGSPFHLGYVRDQFGVCMCMLRLGMVNRARKMLVFYLDVFRKSGKILNAQGLGVPGLFHFAENDRTEITGYLLLQFFRYAEFTGDYGLLRDNADFLVWLYKQQESQIHNNMLPFNGDETYIAGGLLPRDVINEGSAEATMLFILSGKRLLEFLENEFCGDAANGNEPPCNTRAMKLILKAVESDYRRNFVIDGKYTLNNPERLKGLSEPLYRYGVCMNMGRRGPCDFFGWTARVSEGVYICPKCKSRSDVPEKINKRFYLPTALLMPAYLGTDLPGDDEITETLNDFAGRPECEGSLFSDEDGKKNIGYDYGLLLIGYVKYGLPGQSAVAGKILSLSDGVGTWAERYIDNRPDGARFRPWESAVNLDALLRYCEKYADIK